MDGAWLGNQFDIAYQNVKIQTKSVHCFPDRRAVDPRVFFQLHPGIGVPKKDIDFDLRIQLNLNLALCPSPYLFAFSTDSFTAQVFHWMVLSTWSS